VRCRSLRDGVVSYFPLHGRGRQERCVSLNWKEIVFNVITPAGTSKRVLEWCLDGVCRKLEDASVADTEQEQEMGRYKLKWSKTSVIIRRADVMIEIVAAGKSLSDY
jgi:hypothetical protein